MPEYGRGIQNMVNHALTLPTKAERQRCANTIVAIMAGMSPEMRDVPDFKQKLWDHLAVMADYKLDIDYPYEVRRAEDFQKKPRPMVYPMKRIRFRHYGNLLETLLAHLKDMPEGAERDELTRLVADQMKRSLYSWNRDAMEDEKVAADVAMYTDGRVQLDLENFRFSSVQSRPLPAVSRPVMRPRKGARKRF